MEFNKYDKEIIDLLSQKYIFTLSDISDIIDLKMIDNDAKTFEELNVLMDKGDYEAIATFPATRTRATYDDYSYLLVKFKDKYLIVCVWDSWEPWFYPEIVTFKEFEEPRSPEFPALAAGQV